MIRRCLRLAVAAGLLLIPAVGGAADAPGSHAVATSAAPDPVALVVTGEVTTPLALTRHDLDALPRRTYSLAHPHSHEVHAFAGVALVDVLEKAGLPRGEAARGAFVRRLVVVEAADGYRALFTLAALEPSIGDAQVLLVDAADGKPLAAKEGPLQVIAPRDKRPTRWVRQVTALRVLTLP